jgi:arylamine N-acetyltransferase
MLTKLENWNHFTENILKEGRIVHSKPELVLFYYFLVRRGRGGYCNEKNRG